MPVIPENAIQQLGQLPIVVGVLLIAIAGLVAIVWITWKQGRDERSAFLSFFGQQRDLDRALGKQTSETNAGAIGQLADAIRDLIQGMSDKVDQAMDANTNAIRSSNNLIASLSRDVDELLRRYREEDKAAGEKRGHK